MCYMSIFRSFEKFCKRGSGCKTTPSEKGQPIIYVCGHPSFFFAHTPVGFHAYFGAYSSSCKNLLPYDKIFSQIQTILSVFHPFEGSKINFSTFYVKNIIRIAKSFILMCYMSILHKFQYFHKKGAGVYIDPLKKRVASQI